MTPKITTKNNKIAIGFKSMLISLWLLFMAANILNGLMHGGIDWRQIVNFAGISAWLFFIATYYFADGKPKLGDVKYFVLLTAGITGLLCAINFNLSQLTFFYWIIGGALAGIIAFFITFCCYKIQKGGRNG